MQSSDDSALLRQYVDDHSDVAFAALVTRHINLVYSVALRHTGEPDQAEEITQAVFILLANKAGQLRHDNALSSWLFQATRLTASNVVRSETRRHRREQEAHMQSVLDESGSDIWRQIAPLLDDAVAGLSETDRQAIVLRFYEGRSLREVGTALGASEDAAEKRVSRAVERLREFFAERGITVGASGLGVVISANAVQAAPAGLAVTISTAAALAGTTLATTATAIAMTTLQKTLIAATIAAAVGTGIYEARQASSLRNEVQTLHRQQAPLAEQIQQLTKDRDDATRQLAALRDDDAAASLRNESRQLAQTTNRASQLILLPEQLQLALRGDADLPRRILPPAGPLPRDFEQYRIQMRYSGLTTVLQKREPDGSYTDVIEGPKEIGLGEKRLLVWCWPDPSRMIGSWVFIDLDTGQASEKTSISSEDDPYTTPEGQAARWIKRDISDPNDPQNWRALFK